MYFYDCEVISVSIYPGAAANHQSEYKQHINEKRKKKKSSCQSLLTLKKNWMDFNFPNHFYLDLNYDLITYS